MTCRSSSARRCRSTPSRPTGRRRRRLRRPRTLGRRRAPSKRTTPSMGARRPGRCANPERACESHSFSCSSASAQAQSTYCTCHLAHMWRRLNPINWLEPTAASPDQTVLKYLKRHSDALPHSAVRTCSCTSVIPQRCCLRPDCNLPDQAGAVRRHAAAAAALCGWHQRRRRHLGRRAGRRVRERRAAGRAAGGCAARARSGGAGPAAHLSPTIHRGPTVHCFRSAGRC